MTQTNQKTMTEEQEVALVASLKAKSNTKTSTKSPEDQQFVLEVIKKHNLNCSQTIKFLHACGWERGRIRSAMPDYNTVWASKASGPFLYQHVKNTLDKPAKKDAKKS